MKAGVAEKATASMALESADTKAQSVVRLEGRTEARTGPEETRRREPTYIKDDGSFARRSEVEQLSIPEGTCKGGGGITLSTPACPVCVSGGVLLAACVWARPSE